jgi:transcription antitermination factor NusG
MKPGDRVKFISGYHVGVTGKLESLDFKRESARVRLEESPNVVMTVDANTIKRI